MKLTRNEIAVIVNYYRGLEFDAEDQINTLETNCLGVIDSDLYRTQLDRYKTKIKECKDRVAEVTAELDEL